MNDLRERLIVAAVTGVMSRILPPSEKEGYWAEVRDRAHAAVDMADMVIEALADRKAELEKPISEQT